MDRCIATNGKRQTEPEYATTNDFTFLQTEWTEEERAKYTYQQSCTIKSTTEEEARYALKSAEGWADQVGGTGLTQDGRKLIEDSGSGKGPKRPNPNTSADELPRPASPVVPQVWSTTPLVVRSAVPVPDPSGGDCGYGDCNTKKDGMAQPEITFTKLGNEVAGPEEEEHRVVLFEENEDRRREREQLLAKPLPVLNV